MGLDATNKVLLRFKSACSAKVTSWKIKFLLEANSDMMLSKRRITKAQNGPRRSAPLLFAPSAPKTSFLLLFVCFVALRPESTAMVIAGRSVHLTTLFPGQA